MRKSFKKAVMAAGAALLVALTALAARGIDRILTERMAELKSRTISAFESVVGRKITYSAISPSIFQYLEVRDVRIHDSKDPERSLLAIRTIRVSYSLVQLLIHRDPIAALREIRILNTRFSLDLEKDRDLVDLFLRLAGTNTGGEQFHVRLTGANVSVSFAASGTSVSLDNLFFQIEARKEAINVSLRGGARGSCRTGSLSHPYSRRTAHWTGASPPRTSPSTCSPWRALSSPPAARPCRFSGMRARLISARSRTVPRLSLSSWQISRSGSLP